MRFVLALAACTGCVYTSLDTDGAWSSLDAPCVPLGTSPRRLVETRFSVMVVPAGGTLLYSGGEDVSQLDLATGESKIVLRSDALWQFGVFGNDVVYYETNGDPENRIGIDLIMDHGARSTSRYERISPRPGSNHAGLLTTPNGIYWMTTPTLDPNSGREEWRWDPQTGSVEPFVIGAATQIRTDDVSLFYADAANRLVVRPQRPGPVTLTFENVPEQPAPLPIGIDGELLYYAVVRPGDSTHTLIERGLDREERTLASGRFITAAALDPRYVYFTADIDDRTGRRSDVFRVPRTGGPIETYFKGEDNTAIYDVIVDRCNVYWQMFTIDGGAIYGREIMQ